MSSITTPARNRQAMGTVGILNTARWVGTIVILGLAALTGLATLVLTFTSDNGILAFFGGTVSTVMIAVFGALYYAVVGWYVDSLNLLVQIEKNTQR